VLAATAALAAGALAGPAVADETGHHNSVCDPSHPVVAKLIADVQDTIKYRFPDEATLIARGFIPYFDAMVRGYPPGENGAGHWLNPAWIDDGNMLDPREPESILVDQYGNTMGAMFIADEEYPHGIPLYTAEDGSVCQPWHPHTDWPARIGWWYFETLYDGDAYKGEIEPDEETAAMMHVWGIQNDHGWDSHEYPDAKYREGPPDSADDLPGMRLPTLPTPPALPTP
jgi:hypothetical protein